MHNILYYNSTVFIEDKVMAQVETLLNETIEERVSILEIQVDFLSTEVVDQAEDLDRIEGEIAVILTDQVQQDQRILELEQDSDSKLLE